jgi:hypothetical protein
VIVVTCTVTDEEKYTAFATGRSSKKYFPDSLKKTVILID